MSVTNLVRRPKVEISADGGLKPRGGRPAPTPTVIAAAAVLALIALFVVWPGLFTGWDPIRSDVANSLRGPSGEHWFGTDR
ncbi:MAG: hypothetical protein ACTIBU_03525, partial [Microbacterium gubbeenense]